MGVVYNRKGFGLYENGCGQYGDATNFSAYTAHSTDSLSNGWSHGMLGTDVYGAGKFGDELVPVDLSKTYQHSVSAKSLTNNYLGNPGSGYLGYSCYDKDLNFIDLRQLGGIGNTTLARDLNAGDSYIYITSKTGWYENASPIYYFSVPLFYPATHPDYSTAYEYTRIGAGAYNVYYNARDIPLTGSPPSYRLEIVTSDTSTPTTFPSVGYSTPAGTPISNGQAGGTYNYAHGAPIYSGSWTTYTSSPVTGGTRGSGAQMRYATAYIKFMNLCNYNYRLETSGVSATYALDNIMLVECPNGTAWPDALFSRTNTL